MRARSVMGALVFAFATAGPAAAQAWDNPSFFAPRAHDDVGLYAVNAEFGDLGFAAIWRQSGNINLGVRGGIGGTSDVRVWLLGAELYGPLPRVATGLPLLLAWNTGVGADFGGGITIMRIPVGISVGLELSRAGITVVPYAHPRLVFELIAEEQGDGSEETATDFDYDLDLGADIQIGERWIIRGGASLPRSTTYGFGIAYRIPRPISIR